MRASPCQWMQSSTEMSTSPRVRSSQCPGVGSLDFYTSKETLRGAVGMYQGFALSGNDSMALTSIPSASAASGLKPAVHTMISPPWQSIIGDRCTFPSRVFVFNRELMNSRW